LRIIEKLCDVKDFVSEEIVEKAGAEENERPACNDGVSKPETGKRLRRRGS